GQAPPLYRSAPRPGASGTRVASASENAATLIGMTTEQAMKRGILFVGNPDTVHRQIMDFHAEGGGFGHLVLVGRTGHMTHEETEKSIKLFSREVLPRLRDIPTTIPG